MTIDEINTEIARIQQQLATANPADLIPLMAQMTALLAQKESYSAEVEGSGNLVNQGNDNVIATQGGVAARRDINFYVNADPGQIDPADLRRAYLERVVATSNQLSLAGIERQTAGGEERLELAAVYTSLMTQTLEREDPSEKESRSVPKRLSALNLLNRWDRLVLLGEAGSGKSTFVNFVALCHAGALIGHEILNLDLLTQPLPPDDDEDKRRRSSSEEEESPPTPQPWVHGPLLPVTLVLKDFAAGPHIPAAGEEATAQHFWDHIRDELSKAGLGEYFLPLKKELIEEGGLILLDGLDEVPTDKDHRLHIRQMVGDMEKSLKTCRILVTSRTYAYQNQKWRLPLFEDAVLADFGMGQIERFVDQWYAHIGRVRHMNEADAQGRAELLKSAIRDNRRLRFLAERPLLLTLMASLHAWRGGSLPDKREQLYAESVELLLERWAKRSIVHAPDGKVKVIQPSLEQWLKIDRQKVFAFLCRLAYEAHADQSDLQRTADIPQEKLVMGLLALSDDASLPPQQLIEFLTNRAGILVPRGVGIYTFPHRTFQEYLAAVHLTDSGYPKRLAALARSEPNKWREVAQLAGAKAASGAAYALWALVDKLVSGEPKSDSGIDHHWGAIQAAQLLIELTDGVNYDDDEAAEAARIARWLVAGLASDLPATERAKGGVYLARLGDPRKAVIDVDHMRFAYVPPGPFVMGEGEDEHRQERLTYGYWLAEYPVTYAQYQTFLEEDGYFNPDWWAVAAQARVWQPDQGYNYGNEPRYRGEPNQPVRGISWYEALAYTRWLTRRWNAWLPNGFEVNLPSEAEWHKGARGGDHIPLDPRLISIQDLAKENLQGHETRPNPLPKRSYPWGETEPLNRANYDAHEINNISSVGAFPKGGGPYGNLDLGGNVWEWTRTLRKGFEYPYNPFDGRERLQRRDTDWTWLCGGAYYVDENRVRCGARDDGYPDVRFYVSGCRIVVSPSLPLDSAPSER